MKEGSAAASPIKMARNSNNLTVQTMVNSILRVPPFGFQGYNPKSTSKDLIKPISWGTSKQKRTTFCEEIAKKKAHVPAANKYSTMADWTKDKSLVSPVFSKSPRTVIADEIAKKNACKEKSSPGIGHYDDHKAYKVVSPRTIGNFKQNTDRTTFTIESQWYGMQTPGHKYKDIPLVSIRPLHVTYLFSVIIGQV